MQYGDIFVEVRQRVAAFKYWNEFLGCTDSYGHVKEGDYLDDAYRFLFTTASRDFIGFCAKKEGVDFKEYCDLLDIRSKDLI